MVAYVLGRPSGLPKQSRPAPVSPLPPVSFKNTGVSSSFSLPAIARSSSTVPRAMIFPFRMMLMRSHISCATSSVCVLMRIATPCSLMRLKTLLMSFAPRGSSPTIGSSTSTACGRCRNAAHMTSRCFMPCEKLSTSSFSQRPSSNRSSISRTRWSRPLPFMP